MVCWWRQTAEAIVIQLPPAEAQAQSFWKLKARPQASLENYRSRKSSNKRNRRKKDITTKAPLRWNCCLIQHRGCFFLVGLLPAIRECVTRRVPNVRRSAIVLIPVTGHNGWAGRGAAGGFEFLPLLVGPTPEDKVAGTKRASECQYVVVLSI